MPGNEEISVLRKHFLETYDLARKVDTKELAWWLLNRGYFPESYVLPPSFRVVFDWGLGKPYYGNLKKVGYKQLCQIYHPKSRTRYRTFSVMDPALYHDIVYYIMEDWTDVLNHLFDVDGLRIFSYSFPIPVTKRRDGLSGLRSGRMIYEWIEMAERDVVIESYGYNYLVKTDITDFYNSIYTHIIPWALYGKKEARRDKTKLSRLGSKLDKLIQLSNDGVTKGIPVGPVVSDLIAEIVLARIDREISKQLKNVDLIGARFKDDYKILCLNERDAEKIIAVMAQVFNEYGFRINDEKTQIFKLPDGLYRSHILAYSQFSLRDYKIIPFNVFERTLIEVVKIDETFPGTSIINKFLMELYENKGKKVPVYDVLSDKTVYQGGMRFKLDLKWHGYAHTRNCKNIAKSIALLIKLADRSPQSLSNVLGVIETIYLDTRDYWQKYCPQRIGFTLEKYLSNLISRRFIDAVHRNSVSEMIWLIYFSRYLGLKIDFNRLVDKEIVEDNALLKTIIHSKQMYFSASTAMIKQKTGKNFSLFLEPEKTRSYETLIEQLDFFKRD